MSSTTPFVLPTGISLSMAGNSLVISHDGDVVLEQTLGRRLTKVEAGGDLTLRLSPITGVLQSAQTLTCDGDVDAQEIRGKVVVIDGGKVRARAIVAEERVEIGKVSLSVDVIVAPEVFIHPDAQGRVRIVDCLNDQPPTRVRGCLSLAEYEADFGGADEFMTRRGVVPVPREPEETEPEETFDAIVEDVVVEEFEDIEEIEELEDPLVDAADSVSDHLLSLDAADLAELEVELNDEIVPPEPQDAGPFEDSAFEEIDEDSMSDATVLFDAADVADLHDAFGGEDEGFAVEDAEDDSDMDSAVIRAPIPSRRKRNRAGFAKSRKAITRVKGAYDHLPPPAARVVQLVAEEEFDFLAANLDQLWCDLLRHHAKEGTQPPRAAILGFHQLHSMLG